MRVAVRTGTLADIAVLMKIEADAAGTYRCLPDHAFAADLPVRDRDEHCLVLDKGTSLVAEIDGQAVGFLLALPVDRCAHILELAVALALQGRGIGSLLLGAFEQWAAVGRFREATLTTYTNVPWNAPFYSRRGFETFNPGIGRPELLRLIDEEKRSGVWRAPRVAMRRSLRRRL